MSEGFDYWRGSLDGARQNLLYATELFGNALDMCERHMMCGRWPGGVHPMCEAYSAAALEFHRIVSGLFVRIDRYEWRGTEQTQCGDPAMPGPYNGDFLEDDMSGGDS